MTRRARLVAAGAFALAVAASFAAAGSASDDMSAGARNVNDVAGWCVVGFLALALAAAAAAVASGRRR
jgi:hypothetical protein